jgi:hypothetical protein
MRRLVAGVLLSFALAAPAYAADDGKPKGGPEAGYGGLAPQTESVWTARSFLPLVAAGSLLVLAGTCGLILAASVRRT